VTNNPVIKLQLTAKRHASPPRCRRGAHDVSPIPRAGLGGPASRRRGDSAWQRDGAGGFVTDGSFRGRRALSA